MERRTGDRRPTVTSDAPIQAKDSPRRAQARPLDASILIDMQRHAGNRATLAAVAHAGRSARDVVQRAGADIPTDPYAALTTAVDLIQDVFGPDARVESMGRVVRALTGMAASGGANAPKAQALLDMLGTGTVAETNRMLSEATREGYEFARRVRPTSITEPRQGTPQVEDVISALEDVVEHGSEPADVETALRILGDIHTLREQNRAMNAAPRTPAPARPPVTRNPPSATRPSARTASGEITAAPEPGSPPEPATPAHAGGTSTTSSRVANGRATLDYDGTGVQTNGIDMSEYPPDRPGPVSRFFRDRPVLGQISRIAVHQLADTARALALGYVHGHFVSALGDARQEFEMTYPDVPTLRRNENVDAAATAYDRAYAAVQAPKGRRTGALAATAILTPADQRDAALAQVDANMPRTEPDPAAAQLAIDAGTAYEHAMEDMYAILTTRGLALPDLADDVGRRAEFLTGAANDLSGLFANIMHSPAAAIPVVYYESFTILQVADVFRDLGGRMQTFATEIRNRANVYQQTADALDPTLVKLGAELNDLGAGTSREHVPSRGAPRGSPLESRGPR